MSLRDLATTWAKANCPQAAVQKDFLQGVENALREGIGCSFIIGQNLVKSGKPYLVYCYCGELFAFQLTARQAARLNVQSGMLVSARGLNQQNHEPHPEPPVQLKHVEVEGAEQLDRSLRIVGSLSYFVDQWWIMPLAVQVVCEPPGRTSVVLYHHLHDLPRGEGTVKFSLPPIGDLLDRDGQPFAGVLPLFIQVGISVEPEAGTNITPVRAPQVPNLTKPYSPRPPIPAATPEVVRRLGEHFIPPFPTPTLMTPETMNSPPQPSFGTAVSPTTRPAQIFRVISDVRAVLVDVK